MDKKELKKIQEEKLKKKVEEVSKKLLKRKNEIIDNIHKKEIDDYLFIQKEFSKGNITKNRSFQSVYKHFYGFHQGLTDAFKRKYFELLGNKRVNKLGDVLSELYKIKLPSKLGKNTFQFSYATKLLHTKDRYHKLPMWDNYVGPLLGLGYKPQKDQEKGFKFWQDTYGKLKEYQVSLLKKDSVKVIIKNEKFNVKGITKERALDFVLWSLGKLDKSKMIKAITFDLDMTLEDFLKFKREGTKAAAKAMIKAGLKMPLDKLEKELFSFYLKDIEGNRVFENFLKGKGITSKKILAVGINAYAKAKLLHLKPYLGVKKTLSKLKKKGLKLGIITDAPRLKAYQRLDSIGIVDYFDFLVGKEDTTKRKNSEKPFLKALEILKVKPEEVLHVGDWPERDIKVPKSLGIKTCLANYSYKVYKIGKYYMPDYQIDRFEEIIKLIK